MRGNCQNLLAWHCPKPSSSFEAARGRSMKSPKYCSSFLDRRVMSFVSISETPSFFPPKNSSPPILTAHDWSVVTGSLGFAEEVGWDMTGSQREGRGGEITPQGVFFGTNRISASWKDYHLAQWAPATCCPRGDPIQGWGEQTKVWPKIHPRNERDSASWEIIPGSTSAGNLSSLDSSRNSDKIG